MNSIFLCLDIARRIIINFLEKRLETKKSSAYAKDFLVGKELFVVLWRIAECDCKE